MDSTIPTPFTSESGRTSIRTTLESRSSINDASLVVNVVFGVLALLAAGITILIAYLQLQTTYQSMMPHHNTVISDISYAEAGYNHDEVFELFALENTSEDADPPLSTLSQ